MRLVGNSQDLFGVNVVSCCVVLCCVVVQGCDRRPASVSGLQEPTCTAQLGLWNHVYLQGR